MGRWSGFLEALGDEVAEFVDVELGVESMTTSSELADGLHARVRS